LKVNNPLIRLTLYAGQVTTGLLPPFRDQLQAGSFDLIRIMKKTRAMCNTPPTSPR
jgi:hypothetical protein